SNLFHFNQSTMNSIILGSTGLDLLDSEKFDEQFKQLSLYANKYNTEPFFILFHCPSESEIQAQQREDLFGHLVNRVASQIPFTFTLRCKYRDNESTQNLEDIHTHLRLLLEVPNHRFEEDNLPLLDAFLELQKAQAQAESQLLLKVKPEHFEPLAWGWESDEHIYLKYFAIKTLESLGHDLSQIHCEVQVSSRQNKEDYLDPDLNRRPDIYVENRIIVEVETLRGKGFAGENVFFDLIKRLLKKSTGWKDRLESVWLVLPGFEVARNYYQLKKAQEILSHHLTQKYGVGFRLQIMTPDYENHQLISVSFDEIEYPSFESSPGKPPISKPIVPIRQKIDFSRVKGLHSEKEKLNRLLKLQLQGMKSGIGGILLFGLPGCGKTLIANTFANECDRYFFKFSPAEIQSIWIGQSQKNIRDIFAQAKKKAPSVLFIDEIDSIGFSRNEYQAHTDQKATINQLLIEFNNVRDSDVIVIGATNRLSGLDSALRRSGRFDWKIPIFPPDQFERAELFKHYLTTVAVNLDLVNIEMLAQQSARFTSSDIELVCREVRNAVLLGEMQAQLSTVDVITYITNIQEGGLTLNEDQIREFLDECKQLKHK
ncbi:MAG: ATP-binding protein, partial [Kovacikia sp.]